MSFSDWINKELEDRRWSQADLHRASGLSRSIVSKTVNGQSIPEPETLEAIARAFNIPAEEVYRQVGILPEDKKISDRALRWAYQIEQLPDEEKVFIDVVLEGLYKKRGLKRNANYLSKSGKDPQP